MAAPFQPIAPVRVPLPPSGPEYLHELKWDGFRGVAIVGSGPAAIYSKRQQYLPRFAPMAADIAKALRGRSAILDGEVVCLDAEGHPNFASLMSRHGTPVYAAFALLVFDGEDLRELPLIERKARLEEALKVGRTVRYVSHVVGSGREFFDAACRLDLEGIVSKPLDSAYAGSPWRKVLNPSYSQKSEARFALFQPA
jgi:bifunctional non-homologous end joining protein LigD